MTYNTFTKAATSQRQNMALKNGPFYQQIDTIITIFYLHGLSRHRWLSFNWYSPILSLNVAKKGKLKQYTSESKDGPF